MTELKRLLDLQRIKSGFSLGTQAAIERDLAAERARLATPAAPTEHPGGSDPDPGPAPKAAPAAPTKSSSSSGSDQRKAILSLMGIDPTSKLGKVLTTPKQITTPPPAPFLDTPKGRSDYQTQQEMGISNIHLQKKKDVYGPISIVEQYSTTYPVGAGIKEVFTIPSEQQRTDKQRLRTEGQALIDFEPKTGEGIYYVASPDFDKKYLPTGETAEVVDGEIRLTPRQADIYHANIGAYLLGEADKLKPSETFKTGQEYLKEWHPKTEVITYDPFYLQVKDGKLVEGKTTRVRDDSGKWKEVTIKEAGTTMVHVDFPYFGAEQYGTLSKALKADPGRAAALGWGWGGLGNVDIAIYRLQGKEQKILDRQVEQLAGYKSAKESLQTGDVLGFSKQYWSGYLSSPATQGLAYVGGVGVGALTSKLGASAIVVAHPLLSTGGKIAAIGIGGALVTPQVIDIGKDFYKGDIGKGFGRSTLFGASLAAGYMGFKHGQYTPKFKPTTDMYGQKIKNFGKIKDFIPKKMTDAYGRIKGEIGGYKQRGITGKELIRNIATEKLELEEISRQLAFNRLRNIERGFSGTKGRGGLFKTDTGTEGIIKIKTGGLSKLFKITAMEDKIIGTGGMQKVSSRPFSPKLSTREGILSSELFESGRVQPFSLTRKLSFDRFVNYMAKDPYEASWDLYRTTIPQLVTKTVPMETGYTIKFGKGVTYTDKVYTHKTIKVWENMFAESPYSSKSTLPQLESDTLPLQFRQGAWLGKDAGHYQPKIGKTDIDLGVFKGGKGLNELFKKPDIQKVPTGGGKVGQLTESTYKGPSTGTRFKVSYDMTDVRFLNYIEGLAPPYQPTTSILAPPHIKQGIFITQTFQGDLRGPDLKTLQGGRTIFEGEYGAYDFDIIQKQKIKYKPAYETMQDTFTKQDMKTWQLFDFDITQATAMTQATKSLTAQMTMPVQETMQLSVLEPVTIAPPIFKSMISRPYIYQDVFEPHRPFKKGVEPLSPFAAMLPSLGMGGGGRGGGGMRFFGKAKKFRKGGLDMIFGIEV